MRWLFLLLLVIAALAVAGVVTFHHSPGHATVDVNTQRLEEDSQKVIKEGEHLLHKEGEKAGQAGQTQQAPTPATNTERPADATVPQTTAE